MESMSKEAVDFVLRRLEDSLTGKRDMLESECIRQASAVAAAMIGALRVRGTVLFFGDRGWSRDVGHLAAELVGRFYRDRLGLAHVAWRTEPLR